MKETKPGRDVETQVKNLENNLKQILSKIDFEKKKQTEVENEIEKQNETDKLKESNTEIVQALDLKELQDKLMNYQNSSEPRAFPESSCRPPPGFSYPGEEKPSLSEEQTNNNELSIADHFPYLTSTREVLLAGERKNNIMEFKDENTQAGNPLVNWTQNDGKRNYNERSLPKYKGRGRGRRDVTGTLESSKDSSETLGFPGDARGSWNSREMYGFQRMTVRDNSSGYVEWSKNDSPETLKKSYSKPQSGWKDVRRFSEETSGLTKTFDTTEPRAEFGSSSSANAGFGTVRAEFGSSVPLGCFICGGKDHRSAYCKNNAAMFD